MKFCRDVMNERCSADRTLLIETMRAEIEVVLKKIEYSNHDEFYKYALIYNFDLSGFHSEASNIMMESTSNLQVESVD